MKIKEKRQLRDKTKEELQVMLAKMKNELFTLRLEHSQGKLKNTSSLLHKRKDLALMYTVLSEKEEIV